MVTHQLVRPCLHLAREGEAGLNCIESCAKQLRDFFASHQIARLNVAGPKASQEPEVADFVTAVLSWAFLEKC
jgi:hypothetical protein